MKQDEKIAELDWNMRDLIDQQDEGLVQTVDHDMIECSVRSILEEENWQLSGKIADQDEKIAELEWNVRMLSQEIEDLEFVRDTT